MKKRAIFLICFFFCLALSGSASAQDKDSVYACIEKMRATHDLKGSTGPEDYILLTLDKENRIVAGTADLKGFVCLLTQKQNRPYVLDLQTGSEVGILKEARLLKGTNETFLQTEQLFRGEGQDERDYYVLYKITVEKLYKALEIPRYKRLTVGDYDYVETNDLSYENDRLTVSQKQKISFSKENEPPVDLYEATRNFKLVYSEDYRSFISGTALCSKTLGNGWCKEGERIGYRINSLLSEGEGIAYELINRKRETKTFTKVDDMTLIKPEPQPSNQP